jgi:hypothetical protein
VAVALAVADVAVVPSLSVAWLDAVAATGSGALPPAAVLAWVRWLR